MRTIYLDNGATSFPKPDGVSRAMKDYMDNIGATINRSVYGSAQDAGLVTLQLREGLAKLFHFIDVFKSAFAAQHKHCAYAGVYSAGNIGVKSISKDTHFFILKAPS